MNKRQAKKDKWKRMFLVCYKWKANRKEAKIMKAFETYYRFYINDNTRPMELDF